MKKKIIHILSSNTFSGAENVAVSIIKKMTNKYSNLYDFYYASPKGSINKILEKNGVKHIDVLQFKYTYIRKMIKREKPDILHAHDFTASFFIALLPTKAFKIGQIHQNPDWLKNNKTLRFKIFKFTCRRLDKIIFVSNQILDESALLDKKSNKFQVIYNYVDRDNILGHNENIIEKYDVLYVGRLTSEKNPLKFLKICQRLDSNILIGMIGDGYLKKECLDFIEKNNMNNVTVLGYINPPFSFMKKSKIFVSTSNYEGFGLTAIESIISGSVVLVPRVGGFINIFKEIPDCFCDSEDEYIFKINKYLNDEKRKELQLKLESKILKYTNDDYFVNEWKKIYK